MSLSGIQYFLRKAWIPAQKHRGNDDRVGRSASFDPPDGYFGPMVRTGTILIVTVTGVDKINAASDPAARVISD